MSSSLNIPRIDTRQSDVRAALDQLRERLSPRGNIVSEAGRKLTMAVFGAPLTPQQVVERICNEVREDGLAAVLDYSEKLDKAKLDAESLRVPIEDMEAAHRRAEPDFLKAVRSIRNRVWDFQRALLPNDVVVAAPHGGELRQRFLPLERIGVCVPGGAASYPSTVLMTVVPAQAAGVKEIAVIAPPTPLGSYNPTLLATCFELGVKEVYRVGGAQGVAALAYGVNDFSGSPLVKRVDKIVGPGNLFVALAKKYVYGEVDIDSIAGPSEVVVIADESTSAAHTAADMLAQAEHSPGASILITWNAKLIDQVAVECEKLCQTLERGEWARKSLEDFGALILVRDAEEACALADEIAPEHLHIATDNAVDLVDKIPHAGAIFVGHQSPVALGDYAAGPSHVLPTGGTARWASGLSSLHFMRANSVIRYTAAGLVSVAEDIRQLADKEGLTAHRLSVDVRVKKS